MLHSNLDSAILRYIIDNHLRPGDRLPTINKLSREMGMSVSKIREQIEVARALGWIEVKPRLGMQVQAFDFGAPATLGVLYALGLSRTHFQDFSKLRNSLELSFWVEAVSQLTPDDITELREIVTQAFTKLNHVPIEVPFAEHRKLHLTFFKHLKNPFVMGLLEAYWAAYKAFGLGLYADLAYHRKVWVYHREMVDCVAKGNYEAGREALREHMALLRYNDDQPGDGVTTEGITPIQSFFE